MARMRRPATDGLSKIGPGVQPGAGSAQVSPGGEIRESGGEILPGWERLAVGADHIQRGAHAEPGCIGVLRSAILIPPPGVAASQNLASKPRVAD